MRPERCWPLAVGVLRWTRAPRGGVGGPELQPSWCGARLVGPGRWRARTRPLSGVGPRSSLVASPRPRLPIGAAAAWCRATGSESLLLQGFSPVLGAPAAGAAHPQSRLPYRWVYSRPSRQPRRRIAACIFLVPVDREVLLIHGA